MADAAPFVSVRPRFIHATGRSMAVGLLALIGVAGLTERATATLAMAGSASASASAFAAASTSNVRGPAEVHPVITDRATSEFMRALGRTSAETSIAEISLMDYRDAVLELAEDHDARVAAAEAGGGGGGGLNAFLDRQIAVLEVGRESWHRASDRMAELTQNLRLFYGEDREVAPLIQQLERAAFIRSLQSAGGATFEAGESIDLIEMVRLARTAELGGAAADAAAIDRAVNAWAATVGPMVRDAAGEAWLGRIDRRIASATGDPGDLAAAEQRICQAWARLRTPLDAAVDAIAAAAGTPEAEASWRRRVRHASHPWLVGRDARRLEQARGWMQRNAPGLEADAAAILGEWAVRRDADEMEAARMVEDARRELSRVVTPMTSIMDLGSPPLQARHAELLRNSGRLKETDDNAYVEIRSLLPVERRGRFDRDVGVAANRR
ncbi:MAG: hypothetical protein AB8G96_08585 [Phycisphaerales bacterium]